MAGLKYLALAAALCAASAPIAAQDRERGVLPAPAAPTSAERNDIPLSDPVKVIRGVVQFDGADWFAMNIKLENWGKGLVSLRGKNRSPVTHVDRGVQDILGAFGALYALLEASGARRLARWNGTAFESLPDFDYHAVDPPLMLVEGDGVLLVVSTNMIRFFSPDGRLLSSLATSRPLNDRFEHIPCALTGVAAGRSLYVGCTRGEWGGALDRVDLDSGVVTELTTIADASVCIREGKNHCHNITGLGRDPFRPDCALATAGLAHKILREGRILRICGERLDLVYENLKVESYGPHHSMKFASSEPFYKIESSARGAVAWGEEGVVIIARAGDRRARTMARLLTHADVRATAYGYHSVAFPVGRPRAKLAPRLITIPD